MVWRAERWLTMFPKDKKIFDSLIEFQDAQILGAGILAWWVKNFDHIVADRYVMPPPTNAPIDAVRDAKKNKSVKRCRLLVENTIQSFANQKPEPLTFWPFPENGLTAHDLFHWSTGLHLMKIGRQPPTDYPMAAQTLQLATKLEFIHMLLMSGVDPLLFNLEVFEKTIAAFTAVPAKIIDKLVNLSFKVAVLQPFGIDQPIASSERKKLRKQPPTLWYCLNENKTKQI